MQISPTPAPAAPVTPAEPTAPTPRPVLARLGYEPQDLEPNPALAGMYEVRLTGPLPGAFTAFDQAVDAARDVARADRKEARVDRRFPFRDKYTATSPIAVFDTAHGYVLARTSGTPIDAYDYLDGYIFRQWQTDPAKELGLKVAPELAALVGHSRLADLRGEPGVRPVTKF